MNESLRHCISMTRMLNSDSRLLADCGLDNQAEYAVTADKILYSYARDQCQSAAMDELFGNPADDCFKVYPPPLARYKAATAITRRLGHIIDGVE